MYRCIRSFVRSVESPVIGTIDTMYGAGQLVPDSTYLNMFDDDKDNFEPVVEGGMSVKSFQQMAEEESERRRKREEEDEEERNRQRNIILNQELLDVSINPDYSTPDPTPDPTPDNFDYGGGDSGGGGASGDY